MTTLRSWARDHRADLLALVALVALGVAFLFETVAMNAVPVARDIQLFFIPHKHILWESLQRLEIPLWTPLIRTGYPVLANFQSGVFYPPHWLYAALQFFAAFNLLIVLHLVLGGVGFYVLCRRLDFGPPAAWVAAVSFMLGGYFVSLTNLINVLQTAAWAPAMVLTLVHHVERWRPASLVGMVAVYLAGFLAGEPQTFLLASAVALCFGLVWSSGRSGAGALARRTVAAMGITAVAVAGLAAVQILPTLQMISLAERGSGLTLEQSGRYPLALERLVHLVLANDFTDPVYRFGKKLQVTAQVPWLFSVYLGLPTVVLAWHARWDRARSRQVLFWTGLALVGVVLSLGPQTPVFRGLHAHLPGFSAFRYPEKFFLLTALAVPSLAAHGTDALLRRRGPDRTDAAAAFVVLVAGLAVLAAWIGVPDRVFGWIREVSPDAPLLDHFDFAYVEWGGNLEVALALLAATVGLVGLFRRGHLGRGVLVGLLCAIVPLDFWLANRGVNPVVERSFYTRAPAVHDVLPLEELRRTYRYRATPFEEHIGTFYTFPDLPVEAAKWMWQRTMQPGTGVLWGVQGHGAEDAIHLKSVRASDELLKELPPAGRRRLLRIASVKYVYHPLASADLPRSRIVRVDSVPGFVYRLEGVVPRAYLAHGRRFREPVAALNAILAPDAHYRRTAMILAPDAEMPSSDEVEGNVGLDAPADTVGDPPPNTSSARIVADEGEEITVRVEPDTASYLVLTDTWYPGWHARVDGEERPLRRANFFFKAVRVRPGDETVVFRYRSRALRRGAWITGGTALLLLAGLAVWWRRRRRRRDAGGDRSGDAAAPQREGPPGG